ncbi:MAG: DnaJ C-terminal domain-containing protein [Myxococcota bacterium]
MAEPTARNRPDLYAVLGVDRGADAEAIKAAYRKLARELHPDISKEDDAEERFKEVGRAYQVLSDPERRRDYDEFGDIALDPGFDAAKAREMSAAFGRGAGFPGFGPGGFEGGPREAFEFAGSGPGSFGDWLNDLLRGARAADARPAAARGADLTAELSLDFREAALGCEKRLSVSRPRIDGGPPTAESLRVRIPPGVADGGRIRLAGKGAVGVDGAADGDLHVVLRVRPHPHFERRDRDLHIEVPISVSEALLGAEIEVPTLDGRAKLTVPAGTDGGTRLRLRGKGIPAARGAAAGDLYVRLRIRVPRELDAQQREAAASLVDAGPEGLRDELFRS